MNRDWIKTKTTFYWYKETNFYWPT